MHSQSSSTRDCVQILLASSNQFYIIGYVDGTTISSLAPNSTCPRWLGMPRRKVYARHSMGGDARRDTRQRRASQFIRRSYVKENIKCCTSTSVAAAFALARGVVTFLALLTFVLVRCRSSFGCRWSVGILLPMTPGRSMSLPTTIRIGIPRLFSLIPS